MHVPEAIPSVFPTQTEATGAPSHRSQLQEEIDPLDMDPFVLFGSSFPKDTEYTQVHACEV